MLELLILLLTVGVNISLGITVYIKNPKGFTNRAFAFLISIFVIWSVVSYISVNPALLSQLTWVRLVMFFAAILNFAVFLTFLSFPNKPLNAKYRKFIKIALVGTLVVLPLTLSPLVFKSLDFSSGKAEPVPSPGIALFMLQTLSLIGLSFYLLIHRFKKAKGIVKNQLRLVLFAVIGTFGLIITTNFLLVVLFNITALVPLAPSFTLLFSGALAYAIVKHRLFDIRRVVARALGYLLALGTLVSVYSIIVYLFADKVLLNASDFISDRVIPIVAAIAVGISYPKIKRYFDKVTNRLFYRDAYDPQAFLDEFNTAVSENIELGILLRKSTDVIQRNLKVGLCLIAVLETPSTSSKLLGYGSLRLSDSESMAVEKEIAKTNRKIAIADELGEGDAHLRKVMDDNGIGLIVKLIPGTGDAKKTIASLIIGSKKSGNIYDSKDIKIIEIISDELLIAIQNALRFEEIQAFNVTLQKKINDATARLQRTNQKLKELDETKDEFISMASHQLRTPLTSVKGYTSMVLEGDAGKLNKQQKQLLDQAFVSAQRMVYLIADLLNVSRLKTGKFVIETQPTNLADIIEGEISQLKETAKAKKIKLNYAKPKHFPALMLDETKTRQVIMNFVDNAIYYSHSGGQVKVELKEDKSSIYFRVIDSGIGVPKADVPKLFSKFYRASNARKARPDGTGLGLFMAKKVIDAQGGHLLFETEEGQGSTFGFSFNKKSHSIKH